MEDKTINMIEKYQDILMFMRLVVEGIIINEK